MQRKSVILVVAGAVVFGGAGFGAAMLIPALSGGAKALGTTEAVSAPTEALVSDNGTDEGGTVSEVASIGARSPAHAPIIPASLSASRQFIMDRWGEGANLADSYVQIPVPCGYDCTNLIIGNTETGAIYETGMGFDSMPALVTDSSASSDLVLMMWENLRGGNCQRAVYRWDGQSLSGVSDILEYPYTDAGCGQFNLSLVMSELD